jgi:RNA polymerase sigma-70 factor, ECF subfamily
MTGVETTPRLGPVGRSRRVSVQRQHLAELLSRTAQGDHGAFELIYEQVAPVVFGTVRRVVRDPCLSEEVTQEVFIEIWRRASRFNAAKGSPIAWVATIAHRRAVDRVRAEQRSADRDRRAASPEVAYDQVAESAEHNLDLERVRHCLKRLTDLQREVVTLAYYRGYTYREVAGLLGVPAGTVSTRMRDGLIRLRDCLGVGSQ